MRVLAIDTALAACAAAVLDTGAGGIVASESLAMTRGHAEALMPLIARVMDAAELAFADIDRVVVTTGPGSFTGLRVGIAAARGIALAAQKPAVGLSTLSAYAAPHMAANDRVPVIAAIDARHNHVYLQVFAPGGRSFTPPRLATLAEAVQAAAAAPAVIVGSAAEAVAAGLAVTDATPIALDESAAPDIDWVARMGAVVPKGCPRRSRNICVRPTPSRKTPPNCRAARHDPEKWIPAFRKRSRSNEETRSMNFVTRLLSRPAPKFSEAGRRDAAAFAAVHAASFPRGWGEDEFLGLIAERAVTADRVTSGRSLVGFVLSQLADDKAEILSLALAPAWRGRGLSRPLLDLHLRRLAGRSARAVFLEVDEHNVPACRLYARSGFIEVGRRQGYYDSGATALVLRRDLG